ncbi:MAG: shikimate kinase [Dehalococcoidia bacterium]|nr:shikimate kinase [Dehalococcoidia bacterium]
MATKNNYTNIFIIGFSGSGKSVIGKKISKQLKLSFIDTDREIELLENKEIHQIIEKKGELFFRTLETKILKKINYDISNVISTGGGLPILKENVDIMIKNGIIIWLDASLETIKKRLIGSSEIRPLLGKNIDNDNIVKLYKDRKKNYNLANIKVTTDNKTTNKVVKEILDKLDER